MLKGILSKTWSAIVEGVVLCCDQETSENSMSRCTHHSSKLQHKQVCLFCRALIDEKDEGTPRSKQEKWAALYETSLWDLDEV